MMKSMTRFLFVSFLIVSILIGSVSCSPNIEDYKDYRCYDYHLRYLNVSKGIGKYKFQSEENNTTYMLEYKNIIGENQTEIIGATVSETFGWLSSRYDRVLQNPQTYISIIDEWTIEKIQFYVYDVTKAEEQDVIFESSDSDAIESFKTMISEENHAVFDVDSNYAEGYEREFSKKDNEKQLYLRVIFSESENVVWETKIVSYFHSSNNERIFAIDLGKSVDDGYSSENLEWKKLEDQTLQRLFEEFINQIDSDS
ncbi:MAG: hypothetical protein E7603_00120 [Ruminococcaceae bacterium]|nr:hypothetical protein [Oscillospiraceae bacterium]